MKRFIPYSYEVTWTLHGVTNVHRCTAFREIDIDERIDDRRSQNVTYHPRFYPLGEFLRMPSAPLSTTPSLISSSSDDFLGQNLSLVTAGLRDDGLRASDPIDPHDPQVISTDHDWAYARAQDFADRLVLGISGDVWSSAHGLFGGRLHPAPDRQSRVFQVRDLLDGWRLGTMAAMSIAPMGQVGLVDAILPDDDLDWAPDLAQPDDIRAADLVHHLCRGIRHDPAALCASRHVEAATALLAMQARLQDLQSDAPARADMAESARNFIAAIIEDPADRLSSVVRPTCSKAWQHAVEQIDFCEAVIADAHDLSLAPEDIDALAMLTP